MQMSHTDSPGFSASESFPLEEDKHGECITPLPRPTVEPSPKQDTYLSDSTRTIRAARPLSWGAETDGGDSLSSAGSVLAREDSAHSEAEGLPTFSRSLTREDSTQSEVWLNKFNQ